MSDEITQKHLDRLRVRGAPAIIPGSSGLVTRFDVEEVTRHATRTLAIDLDSNFTIPEIREGQQMLARVAVEQKLKVLEDALIILKGNPTEDMPHEWEWELALPVRGRALAVEDKGIRVSRLQGAVTFVQTGTTKGFGDLDNLYTYVLCDFLVQRKQQLAQSVIYHQITDGLDQDDPTKVSIMVSMPIQLSLKPPSQLVPRNLLD